MDYDTKLHASADKGLNSSKNAFPDAAVSYTTVFEALLDLSNASNAVYCDRGHPSAGRETALKQAGWQIQSGAGGIPLKVTLSATCT